MKTRAGRGRRIARVIGRLIGLLLLLLVGVVVIAYWRSTNECADPDRVVPQRGMRAWVQCEYGSPSVLRLETLAKPVPGDSQLLVRVHAVAVNPLDWHYLRGEPYLARPDMGLRKPKQIQVGVDFAGTVEAVGRAVTQYQPGDTVYGGRTGAFAEYVVVRADRVAPKPANVTIEQAAGVGVAGVTALQGVRDHGEVKPGHKVLINGASGGIGTFAVQIAKAHGAEVTGVSSTRNIELVRSLGADHTIDYTQENFTEGAQRYDVIIDNVGNHSLSDLRRVLAPGGRYVMIGGPSGKWLKPIPRVLAVGLRRKLFGQDMRFFIATLNRQDLMVLHDLMAAGQVTPVIDRRYRFQELPQAIEYLETGRARAKVIVVVD